MKEVRREMDTRGKNSISIFNLKLKSSTIIRCGFVSSTNLIVNLKNKMLVKLDER
jgi:hypothetical protein